jgi:hypothetical protein
MEWILDFLKTFSCFPSLYLTKIQIGTFLLMFAIVNRKCQKEAFLIVALHIFLPKCQQIWYVTMHANYLGFSNLNVFSSQDIST